MVPNDSPYPKTLGLTPNSRMSRSKVTKMASKRHDFFGPDFETAKNRLNIAKIKKTKGTLFYQFCLKFNFYIGTFLILALLRRFSGT